MPSIFKTLYNGRKSLAKLVKAKVTGRRIPVRVCLLVTKYCNLTCFFCYAEDILNSKAVQEYSLDNIKNIVDQLYKAECRQITIVGGEPLIRDDIGEIIDYIHDKGIFVEMTTNGYFVKKRIEALKKVDHLCISLDGNKESNDKSRGEGSFEKIIEGIKCATENGIAVRVHATLSKITNNEESLKFLVEFCKRMDVKLNISEISLPGIEQKDAKYLLSKEESRNFYKVYRGFKKSGYPIASSYLAMDYVERWPLGDETTLYKKDLDKVSKGSYFPCTFGRTQAFVSADGNVYPCTKKWGDGKNIFEVGFDKAWKYFDGLDCVACKELGCIEQSAITNLTFRTLFNTLKNFALMR